MGSRGFDFTLVSDYVAAVRQIESVSALENTTETAVQALGFDYFAILHHLELDYPGAPPGKGQVRFSNYPQVWREAIQQHRLIGVDPVLAASQRTAHGFLWSDVPDMISLSPRQRDVLALAACAGMGEGYTIPVHIPGEYVGSSSFGVRKGKSLSPQALPLLHYMGGFAFEAGRRLACKRLPQAEHAKLTDRQTDCIILAARGCSARAAAKALGIKQDTVQKHLEDAKRRVGVQTTTQLVVRSLFDGRITFSDALKQNAVRS